MDPNELTPQNAPRTAPELRQKEIFRVRRLAEIHLASIRTDEEKLAWYSMSTDARINYVVALLKRWDEQNPGGYQPDAAATNGTAAVATPAPEATRAPVTSAPATRAPAVQQMTPMLPNGAPGTVTVPPALFAGTTTAGAAPLIPQVSTSAVAAAVSATADNKPKRAPKTTAITEAPPADLSADIINLLNRISKAQEDDRERFAGLLEGVQKTLEEAASAKNSRLEQQLKLIEERLAGLEPWMASTSQLQTWLLMIMLSNQADTTNSSPVDVLRQALEASANFNAIVAQARGKV